MRLLRDCLRQLLGERETIGFDAQRLTQLEVSGLTGAGYGEKGAERGN